VRETLLDLLFRRGRAVTTIRLLLTRHTHTSGKSVRPGKKYRSYCAFSVPRRTRSNRYECRRQVAADGYVSTLRTGFRARFEVFFGPPRTRPGNTPPANDGIRRTDGGRVARRHRISCGPFGVYVFSTAGDSTLSLERMSRAGTIIYVAE